MILKVVFAENNSVLKMIFAENNSLIKADFGEIVEIVDRDVSYYEGPYLARPTVSQQILETAQLMMRNDVVIEQIPYYKVSNNKGGDTVTIG